MRGGRGRSLESLVWKLEQEPKKGRGGRGRSLESLVWKLEQEPKKVRGGGGGVGEGLVASTPFLFLSFPLLLFDCASTFEL